MLPISHLQDRGSGPAVGAGDTFDIVRHELEAEVLDLDLSYLAAVTPGSKPPGEDDANTAEHAREVFKLHCILIKDHQAVADLIDGGIG